MKSSISIFFFFNDTATTEIYTLSLHDALPIATAAKWSAATLGGFVQDEYTGIKNLKIIGGIRMDVPIYLTDLPKNNYLNAIDLNGEKLRVGAWPTIRPLFSPRIGFNWDVKGD